MSRTCPSSSSAATGGHEPPLPPEDRRILDGPINAPSLSSSESSGSKLALSPETYGLFGGGVMGATCSSAGTSDSTQPSLSAVVASAAGTSTTESSLAVSQATVSAALARLRATSRLRTWAMHTKRRLTGLHCPHNGSSVVPRGTGTAPGHGASKTSPPRMDSDAIAAWASSTARSPAAVRLARVAALDLAMKASIANT
eukprot:CAMPEP_0117505616 /NCGR_PEP_ID=MMETSP0784-20121206/25475_1 /TAXON_ID=39447 /ORGANISM="" /LENGTH=198 /DNA_ID=CAMNT_0005301045 /DNA_START=138 /DNA_END=734 /DNA_ORIENTATION=-